MKITEKKALCAPQFCW